MKGGTASGAAMSSRPDLSPGKIRALDEPGGSGSDKRGGERRCNDERDRIEEEGADERTKQQADGVAEIDGWSLRRR